MRAFVLFRFGPKVCPLVNVRNSKAMDSKSLGAISGAKKEGKKNVEAESFKISTKTFENML